MIDDDASRALRVRRFSGYRIAEHWLCAAAVALLAVTGLCQKFNTVDLCQWLIMHLGGIDTARLAHRIGGSFLALLVAQHVLVASWGMAVRQWKPLMLVNRKDFADAATNLKYYFGFRDSPAQCDRYSYNQKFEYWAILIGLALMVVSGFALWFPTLVTQVLPGVAIPAAKALHTNEALLIFLLIALWHVYNAIFSPEVFPFDTSIVTGHISRERMACEHPLELARLEKEAAGGGSDPPASSRSDLRARLTAKSETAG